MGRQESQHKALIEYLKNYGDDDEADLAESLSKLRTYRNKADYYQGFRNNIVRNAKQTAKDINSLLDNLKN